MQDRIERIERGESAEQIAAAAATPAKGFTLGLRAALMALSQVFRRFCAVPAHELSKTEESQSWSCRG